jgi:hypothetical protein
MYLHKHLLSPSPLVPEDFEENLNLVNEICETLHFLHGTNDPVQIALFLMRIGGTPLETVMTLTGLARPAIEQRLTNLCNLVAQQARDRATAMTTATRPGRP